MLPVEDVKRILTYVNRKVSQADNATSFTPVWRVMCAKDLVCAVAIMFGYEARLWWCTNQHDS